MNQKSSTVRLFLAACIAALAWSPFMVNAADEVQVQDNAPQRYTVQKGDTLWGIARKFLKQPWRWPEVWRMNLDQIRNPHLIYPGEVVVLDRSGGQLRMSLEGTRAERPTVRLSPRVRSAPLDEAAIPSIPSQDIEPFLTKPLIVARDGLQGAAKIVAGREDRAVRGTGDIIYVLGIDPAAGSAWTIYRMGPPLRQWGGPEILGYEARYLGTATVDRFGETSTLRVTSSREEILVGDSLLPAPKETLVSYAPHAPDQALNGRIIALADGAKEAGRGSVITMDVGALQGVEIGHVVAIYHPAPIVKDPRLQYSDILSTVLDKTTVLAPPDRFLSIPDDRIGLAFVFRVFDNVAYALIVNSDHTVRPGDVVHKP